MHREQPSHDAKLIAQCHQAFVRDVAVLWRRIKARPGIGAAKASAYDAPRR